MIDTTKFYNTNDVNNVRRNVKWKNKRDILTKRDLHRGVDNKYLWELFLKN